MGGGAGPGFGGSGRPGPQRPIYGEGSQLDSNRRGGAQGGGASGFNEDTQTPSPESGGGGSRSERRANKKLRGENVRAFRAAQEAAARAKFQNDLANYRANNLTSYGPSEQFFNKVAGQFGGRQSTMGRLGAQLSGRLQGPSQSEQYMNSIIGRMQGPTSSQNVFSQMQNMKPHNLDAAYNRARDRQAGGINEQLAARGQYGSSAGLDQLSEGQAALNSQQANAEAQMDMQARQQMMQSAQAADTSLVQQLGLGGQLAGQSDTASIQNLSLLGNLAQGSDNYNVNKFGALGTAAANAGNERLNRIGQSYNQSMGMVDRLNEMNRFYATMGLKMDEGLMGQALSTIMGQGALGVNSAMRDIEQQAQNFEMVKSSVDTAANIVPMI